MRWTWWTGLGLAWAAVALGWYLGEATQVLMNAATVCLSCMGIG